MSAELAQRLLIDAQDTERMRDRYAYKGNEKYPRQFPGSAYAALDRKAKDLRAAAELIGGAS